jgi:CO/xanthine dehydrogenase Mo-binding subunit
VHTALPMLVAEEMGADWSSIRVVMAPVDDFYRNKLTGDYGTHSSSSLRGGYDYLRRVGAEARALLIATAAQGWTWRRRNASPPTTWLRTRRRPECHLRVARRAGGACAGDGHGRVSAAGAKRRDAETAC